MAGAQIWKILVDKIKRETFSRFFIHQNTDYRNSIFVAGTGRSGTTWISDIINYRNEYRFMFEPFEPNKVTICRKFRYRQYLRPDNQDLHFITPAKAILSGNVKSAWIDAQNKAFISNKRLIKDIRANLLLKWIHTNFPGFPIILILRHPCAVANSKLKLNWGTHLEEFLSQDALMNDFLDPFRKPIEEARGTFDKHIFLWCIENYVPLKQFSEGELHLIFYENLCQSPKQELDDLFSFLGKHYDESIFCKLRNVSATIQKDSAIIAGNSLVDGWRKNITSRQIKRAIEILNLFGLDSIYSENSMPHMHNVHFFRCA